jgi:hypothetical protein
MCQSEPGGVPGLAPCAGGDAGRGVYAGGSKSRPGEVKFGLQGDNPAWARGAPTWPSRNSLNRPSRGCKVAAWRRFPARPDPPDPAQPGRGREEAQPGLEWWPGSERPQGPAQAAGLRPSRDSEGDTGGRGPPGIWWPTGPAEEAGHRPDRGARHRPTPRERGTGPTGATASRGDPGAPGGCGDPAHAGGNAGQRPSRDKDRPAQPAGWISRPGRVSRLFRPGLQCLGPASL